MALRSVHLSVVNSKSKLQKYQFGSLTRFMIKKNDRWVLIKSLLDQYIIIVDKSKINVR